MKDSPRDRALSPCTLMPADFVLNALRLTFGVVIFRILLLLKRCFKRNTKANTMESSSSPPPPVDPSPDPTTTKNSPAPPSAASTPPSGRTDTHSPLPQGLSRSQKRWLKAKKSPLPTEPQSLASEPKQAKSRGLYKGSREDSRSSPGTAHGPPPQSLTKDQSTHPGPMVQRSTKPTPSKKSTKKTHPVNQDIPDDWKLEPELPEDMRKWAPFLDSLSEVPKRDSRTKRSRVNRRDAQARMLRFLVSYVTSMNSPSRLTGTCPPQDQSVANTDPPPPAICHKCQEGVRGMKQVTKEPGTTPPSVPTKN